MKPLYITFPGGCAWRLLLAASLAGCASLPAPKAPAGDLPWQTWDDPRQLPRLAGAGQVLLQSSHCPDGCRFDRHSQGDSRFLRLDGDEGVIFEDVGPGAIVRIWMTMGEDGVSTPLDPGIGLRIYFDGEDEPRVDMPLQEFFAGDRPPFLTPLVGDRLASSGGNYSYLPMPYRDGCRIALTGAAEARIWFQVTYHRLSDAGGIVTFSGDEDRAGLAALLANPGGDPWPESEPAEIVSGDVSLAPGESSTFYAHDAQGLLTGLRLTVPEAAWEDLHLVLMFDGHRSVDLPLRDAFALGRGGPIPEPALATRSLFAGLDPEKRLYLYFPMPYFEGVAVRLAHRGTAGEAVTAGYWLRRSARLPFDGSGHFGIQTQQVDPSSAGMDLPLLELGGAGKWVGLFADLGSIDTPSRQYLEGDERVYFDGSRHPAIYGTGTEDLFGAGFYFDQGPFRQALHGMSYQFPRAGEDVTGTYRLFLTDAPSFGGSIRAGLETGPTGQMPMRSRTVSYYYLRRDPALLRRDHLDLSDAASREDHSFATTGEVETLSLASAFEGEPLVELDATGIYRRRGEASFEMATSGCLGGLRLRRLLDAGLPGQAAVVRVDGQEAAAFPPVAPNPHRRFREVDVDLEAPVSGEFATITVSYDASDFPPPLVGPRMTEFRYELWCRMRTLVFADGFESGDLSGWSDE